VAYQIEVDEDKCIGCGACVDICPVDVYEIQGTTSVPINAEDCVGCESCIEACEENAITIKEL